MKGNHRSSLRACLALLLAAVLLALLMGGCGQGDRVVGGIRYDKEMDDFDEAKEETKEYIASKLEEEGMDREQARAEALDRVNAMEYWVDPWEYYRVKTDSELFEAMRKETPLALMVEPIGREGDEVLYDVDNVEPFEIDLTEGSVTEWETTFKKVNSDKVETFKITFTARPRSNDLLSAATWYEPADPQTDDPAMFLISQMFDPDPWKAYFSVKNVSQNGKSQRFMFRIVSVYLPSPAEP